MGNVAASRESSLVSAPRAVPRYCCCLAVFAPATAVAQQTPQPVFTELFAYDPAAPSQLLRKWRISSQLDSKLQPLRVSVVEDPIGKTVGRVTVQEGDGLDGASEAMLQARRYMSVTAGARARRRWRPSLVLEFTDSPVERGGFRPSVPLVRPVAEWRKGIKALCAWSAEMRAHP
jgi:hypothetical protein